ncbi:dienelactone hydrolase family protein [Comamonas granuli]|uniref:dienelactone hydrolase family protein n=1 Tax=Comamonas granuli TaxID=290309 RepID=UPI00069492E8|nr:dienelactone hydrolase family protein [Comamonas granuli]
MRLARRLTTLALLLCSAAAAAQAQTAAAQEPRQAVSFQAATLTEAGTRIQGELTLPGGGEGRRLPAVVVIHSAGGFEDPTRQPYVQALNQAGIATLELNLFARGNRPKTSRMNLPHTFGALAYLAQHPRIDPARIGILGFSHGGMLALFAASKELNQAYTGGQQQFAAHLALYPVCWAHLASIEGRNAVYPRTVYGALTGAPVHILAAENDAYDAPDTCQKFIAALPPESQDRVGLTMYAQATHGWDTLQDKHYHDPAAAQGRGAQVPHLRSAAAAAQSLDFARQFFTRTLAAP